jgi:hypothetical protein
MAKSNAILTKLGYIDNMNAITFLAELRAAKTEADKRKVIKTMVNGPRKKKVVKRK